MKKRSAFVKQTPKSIGKLKCIRNNITVCPRLRDLGNGNSMLSQRNFRELHEYYIIIIIIMINDII